MSTQIPISQPNQPRTDNRKPQTKSRTSAKLHPKAIRAKERADARKTVATTRPGSKTAKVLHLLQRSGGATLDDLMKATQWQAHSVRGFLSGTLRKKMHLALTSTQADNGERSYSLKS